MSIERWSENIVVAELADDPAFSDDLSALIDQVEADVVTFQMVATDQPSLIELLGREVLPLLRG